MKLDVSEIGKEADNKEKCEENSHKVEGQDNNKSEELGSQSVHEKSVSLKVEIGEKEQEKQRVWIMHFDRETSREGAGVGVWIIKPEVGKSKLCSYKLVFYYNNNVVEYESLILGL